MNSKPTQVYLTYLALGEHSVAKVAKNGDFPNKCELVGEDMMSNQFTCEHKLPSYSNPLFHGQLSAVCLMVWSLL